MGRRDAFQSKVDRAGVVDWLETDPGCGNSEEKNRAC